MNSTQINLILIFAALLPWACIAVAALITPRLTRPDLFFAVTVNPSFRCSEIGQDILREYKQIVWVVSVLALFPVALLEISPRFLLAGLLGPTFVELAGFSYAVLAARRRTLAYHVEPSTEREAELTPRRVSLPGGVMAQAGPFILLGIVALVLALNWQRIPARFPIHWGINGQPNGWASRTVLSVYGILFIAGMLCVLLTGIVYSIFHGGRRIQSSGEAGLRETRFVQAISWFMLGTEYWIVLLFGMIALLPLRADLSAVLPVWSMLAGTAFLIATTIFIAWRMGQGGWRLDKSMNAEKTSADAAPVGDRTPDECWKLGVFYFNRNDPALWVEKRFGVGWTVNMAQPAAWLVLGSILLFSVGSIVIGLLMSHAR
jgi:uncharacterized membrane protein